MKNVQAVVLAQTLLVAVPGLLHAQTNVIPNGDFDTDIAGWTYVGPPEGTMEWDPNVGLPAPGSLRLARPVDGNGGFTARSPCFLTPRGSVWEIRALVRHADAAAFQGSFTCEIGILWFRQHDCTDEPAAVFATEGTPQGSWIEGRLRLSQHSNIQAVQAVLLVQGQLGGECHFDNVRFEATNAGVFLVPAATPTTLIVLALVIAATGLVLLRLQRW